MKTDMEQTAGGMQSTASRPRLSLCMIVRDNAPTIGPCLESIRPWVDEIIVVDTGSVDETPEICRKFGAKMFSFPWIDDFSAARNESLRHATGEWLFWMDSDDTIDEANGRKLRLLADSEHLPDMMGYVLQVHCPGPDDELTVVDHIKVCRNHPEIRFEGPIHEQLLGSIRKLGGAVGFTEIHVVHSGSDVSPEGKRRKVERDLRILKKDLAARPDHPFVLFNFGMTYFDIREFDQAVEWLKRCVAVSPSEQSHVRKAYALLVASFTQSGRLEEAKKTSDAGRRLFPLDAELLFRQGILATEMGQWTVAASSFRGALRTKEERHFSSLEIGITGHRARNNLALVLQKLGRHDQAELQWRMILDERPEYRPAWRGLGESLLAQRRLTSLEVEIGVRSRGQGMRAESMLLEAKRYLTADLRSQARLQLECAAREYPDDFRCQESRAQFLVESGQWQAAEEALLKLTELAPCDGAAWHNLALISIELGKQEQAITCLKESLAVRPKAPHTRQLWEHLTAAPRGQA